MTQKSTVLGAKIEALCIARSEAMLLLAKYDEEIKAEAAKVAEIQRQRLAHQRYIEGIEFAINLLREAMPPQSALPSIAGIAAEKSRARRGEIERHILAMLDGGRAATASEFDGNPSSVRSALKRLVKAGRIAASGDHYCKVQAIHVAEPPSSRAPSSREQLARLMADSQPAEAP